MAPKIIRIVKNKTIKVKRENRSEEEERERSTMRPVLRWERIIEWV
jgi:hypothetical protein